MTTIGDKDTEVRSSKLEIGLSSSNELVDKDFEIVMSKTSPSSKPSSSLSSIPFHVLSESCSLEKKHLKSIRKRFQFPRGLSLDYPIPMRKLVPLPMTR